MPSGLSTASASWRLVMGVGDGCDAAAPARGAVNMAVDEALLESVRRGSRPVIRFYTWKPACLSFGRNQPARNLYDKARAAALGIDVVRRPTGGLAVLHDRELTYSVLAPLHLFGGPRAAYAGINRALVEGLRCLGVTAEQAADVRARGPLVEQTGPCFQTPAAGEVVAHGRKLAGSAQRCDRGMLLQHGSLLLSGSQTRILGLLADRTPTQPPRDGSITLKALIGSEPPLADLVAAMRSGFERIFGTRLAPEPLSRDESASAVRLAEQYDGVDWTWRR
jgi:lipoate-protein ligase A